MDAEIHNLLKNKTDVHDHHNDYFFTTLHYMAEVIGVVSNIIIILVVCCNQSLRTKKNLLLINWSVNDILFDLLTEIRKLLADVVNPNHHGFDAILMTVINAPLFMWIILYKIADGEYFNPTKFFSSLYLIELLAGLLYTFICHSCQQYRFLTWPCPIAFIALLLSLIVREFLLCCTDKKSSNEEEDDKYWLNVVRIYTYNWILFWIDTLSIFGGMDGTSLEEIAWIEVAVVPCIILLYTIQKQEEFKRCFYKLLKREENASYNQRDTLPVDRS